MADYTLPAHIHLFFSAAHRLPFSQNLRHTVLRINPSTLILHVHASNKESLECALSSLLFQSDAVPYRNPDCLRIPFYTALTFHLISFLQTQQNGRYNYVILIHLFQILIYRQYRLNLLRIP